MVSKFRSERVEERVLNDGATVEHGRDPGGLCTVYLSGRSVARLMGGFRAYVVQSCGEGRRGRA